MVENWKVCIISSSSRSNERKEHGLFPCMPVKRMMVYVEASKNHCVTISPSFQLRVLVALSLSFARSPYLAFCLLYWYTIYVYTYNNRFVFCVWVTVSVWECECECKCWVWVFAVCMCSRSNSPCGSMVEIEKYSDSMRNIVAPKLEFVFVFVVVRHAYEKNRPPLLRCTRENEWASKRPSECESNAYSNTNVTQTACFHPNSV